MNELASSELLSMSAFVAFVEVRVYRTQHPGVSYEEAVAAIKRLRAGLSATDFDTARALADVLDDREDWNLSLMGIRSFVFQLVRLTDPWWLKCFPFGRDRVKAALTRDEHQCLRKAGLFEDVPDEVAMEWWDEIAALVRNRSDLERQARSRIAEKWSFEHEKRRLRQLGIEREPRWVALEDNSVGYDIASYDLLGETVVRKLIEVKSTMSDKIILTRGEWRNALTAPRHTVFHVWHYPEEKLYEYTVDDLRPSVPSDGLKGEWLHARMTLSRMQ